MTLRGCALFAGLSLFLLAACQEEEKQVYDIGAFGPDLMVSERLACEEDGGRWGVGANTGSSVCYFPTRDANKQCRAESDCQTMCLARSRTCAPFDPFFGCHEVLQDNGLPATVCIQ